MIIEILYQPGLGLSDHVCLNLTTHVMWRSVTDRSLDLTCTVPILTSLMNLLNSVEWEEALRDLDINSAWKYFSIMFNTFIIMECIPMSVPKKEKFIHHSRS